MFILYRPLHPKTNILSLWKLTDGRLVSFWSSICRGLELVSMSPNVPEARLVTEVATVYSSLHPWVWLTMPIHWHRASKMKVQMSDVMMVYTPWGLQVEKILNTPENETYKLICIFDMYNDYESISQGEGGQVVLVSFPQNQGTEMWLAANITKIASLQRPSNTTYKRRAVEPLSLERLLGHGTWDACVGIRYIIVLR